MERLSDQAIAEMTDLSRLIHKRDVKTEDLGEIYWIERDTGLLEGPKTDWLEFKPEIMRQCKQRRTVIQAGGGCGLYPLLFAKFFDHVITFEPHDLNYYCLALNTHHVPNIESYNNALGHEQKYVTMEKAHETNCGIIHTKDDQPGSTLMVKLDDYAFENVDMIQFDMEGFEDKALWGAEQTIDRWRPVIQIERPSRGVEEFLSKFGYTPKTAIKADTFFAI